MQLLLFILTPLTFWNIHFDLESELIKFEFSGVSRLFVVINLDLKAKV